MELPVLSLHLLRKAKFFFQNKIFKALYELISMKQLKDEQGHDVQTASKCGKLSGVSLPETTVTLLSSCFENGNAL